MQARRQRKCDRLKGAGGPTGDAPAPAPLTCQNCLQACSSNVTWKEVQTTSVAKGAGEAKELMWECTTNHANAYADLKLTQAYCRGRMVRLERELSQCAAKSAWRVSDELDELKHKLKDSWTLALETKLTMEQACTFWWKAQFVKQCAVVEMLRRRLRRRRMHKCYS